MATTTLAVIVGLIGGWILRGALDDAIYRMMMKVFTTAAGERVVLEAMRKVIDSEKGKARGN